MRFSIITITKNNPIGFNKTKQSIEKQLFSDFEWIVIDGDIESDNGIYDAMNKGLSRANGDYVIFMNAGDQLYNENTLGLIANYDADFIYGDAIEANFYKKSKHHDKISKGMITHHQAMIYKKSVIDGYQYDENYTLAADYKFTLRHILSSHAFKYINHPICIFEGGGVSHKNSSLSRSQEILIRNEFGIKSLLTPYRQWLAQLIKSFSPKFLYLTRYICYVITPQKYR